MENGDNIAAPPATQHKSLKHSLLGPSLTKAGQDNVDQKKVAEIIYNASKGSKYFNNEETRDKNLTLKIERILARKKQLEKLDLRNDLRRADEKIAQLELSRDLSQAIVHIDCDAFYAAVEEIERPELKDVPFAVGKGVLTTCNYHARKFGCRSGMAGFVADKLCPDLIHVPGNFAKYAEKAKEVRAVLMKYDPKFESASIDEAYMNFTPYCEQHGMDPEEAVNQMRAEVHETCKITISAGIAANTKLAKICSNQNKPNGQFRLLSDRNTIVSFMRDLPTRKVNGIGRVFERELDAIGVKTCGEIYGQRQYLSKLFGEKAFEFLMTVYLGLGRTDVCPAEDHERKSVGTESTFHDMSDPNELREKLRWIADELEKDCDRTQFKGKTLVLKIKLHTYEVFTRQVAPPKAIHLADDLYKYSLPMLTKLTNEFPNFKLRLMGLRLTHLVSLKKASANFFGKRAANSTITNADQDARNRSSEINSDDDQAGWERWPDEEFEEAAQAEREDELKEIEQLSQEYEKIHSDLKQDDEEHRAFLERKHDNGFAWRAILEEERSISKALAHANMQNAGEDGQSDICVKKEEEMWDCPVCGLAQVAEERSFNAHIDTCLSKGAIKEVIQDSKLLEMDSPKPVRVMAVDNTTDKKRRRSGQSTLSREVSAEKRVKRPFFS